MLFRYFGVFTKFLYIICWEHTYNNLRQDFFDALEIGLLSVCSTILNVAVILSLEVLILYYSTFCGKICDHLFITKDQMATKPAAAVASYIDFWGKKYGCALSSSLQLSRFFQLDKKPMRHHLCCSNFILESIWKRVGRIVQCSSWVKRSWIFKNLRKLSTTKIQH